MPLLEVLCPGSEVKGVRWHKPSRQYIADIGYHQVSTVMPDGTVTTKRVRTTQYLGEACEREDAEIRFESIKRDWEGWVSEQRKVYDAENRQREAQGLPPLPRFKPAWPRARVRRLKRIPPSSPSPASGHTRTWSKRTFATVEYRPIRPGGNASVEGML